MAFSEQEKILLERRLKNYTEKVVHLPDVRQLPVAEVADKNVKVPVIRSGNESQPLAIRRKAGLDVHGAIGGELMRLHCFEVKDPEIHRVLAITHVGDPAAVARAVGLVVVARPRSQLFSGA